MSVLDTLWSRPQRIADVAKETGLSRTTAESVIGDLLALGWIAVENPSSRRDHTLPGRPASTYRFVHDVGRVAGLDIGAHHVSAAVSDLQGNQLGYCLQPAEESLPAARRIDLALGVLADAMKAANTDGDSFWALTIGSPGVIDHGRVMHFGGEGMPGWSGLDIANRFSKDFACPILVEGDCALGAKAEQWNGAAATVNHMVYLLSGVRTGAAVIIDGKLHRGARGGAGLIGELPELRWLEIEHNRYGAGIPTHTRDERANIFERTRNGDQDAREAVDSFASALALGAAAMVLAVDPEMVVLGGPTAQYSDVFIDRFTSELVARCPMVPEIRASEISRDAVLLGTISVGLDYIHRALAASVDLAPMFPAPNDQFLIKPGGP